MCCGFGHLLASETAICNPMKQTPSSVQLSSLCGQAFDADADGETAQSAVQPDSQDPPPIDLCLTVTDPDTSMADGATG